MHRDELNIEAYLRGELPADEAGSVADLLETSASAREHADWLRRLEGLMEVARSEPSAELVTALETRLLALPQRLGPDSGASTTAGARRAGRFTMPVWLMRPTPAVRAAAMLLVGVAIGFGLWGGQGATPEQAEFTAAVPAVRGAGDVMPAAMESPTESRSSLAGSRAGSMAALEERVAALERNIESTYFSRVEAAMLRFVTDAAEGSVNTMGRQDARELLSLTANLKVEHKSADEMRMARLLGQIESVLMEMDRLGRERDLAGARHVASVIEDQGLLTTVQRLKAGIEE